jgi:Tat protein translocase TatB subunit
MFGIGFFELVIIAVVALVVVGPKRLPEVMKQAGRLFVHLRRTANDVRSSFEQVIREAEEEMRREEADSIRKALQPVQDVRQELQGMMQGNLDHSDDAHHHSDHSTHGDATSGGTISDAGSPQGSSSTHGDSSHSQPSSVQAPEHQPHGSQTFNPNGPGPLQKS